MSDDEYDPDAFDSVGSIPGTVDGFGETGFDDTASALASHGGLGGRTLSSASKMSQKDQDDLATNTGLLVDKGAKWFETAIKDGKKIGLFDKASTSKEDPIVMPIFHKFMAKNITEDVLTRQPVLVGTFIQQVCGLNFEGGAHEGKADKSGVFKGQFDFRFNDVTANVPKEIETRRSVPIPLFGTKTTYNVKIPMEQTLIFGVPPYELYEFRALIEMSSSFTQITDQGKQKGVEIRPNIMFNPKEERELFVIRKGNELDKLGDYNLVTLSPRIVASYDAKKKYCPKYEVMFYAEKDSTYKVITTWIPMFFVAVLTTLNVINQDEAGPALDNSIALALTIVFILPELSPEGGDDEIHKKNFIGANTLAILLIFFGQILACVQHPMFEPDVPCVEHPYDHILGALDRSLTPSDGIANGTVFACGEEENLSQYIGMVGYGLVWLAMLSPLWTYYKYQQLRKRLKETSMVACEELKEGKKHDPEEGLVEGQKKRPCFVKDKQTYDTWNPWSDEKHKLDIDNIALMCTGAEMPGRTEILRQEGGQKGEKNEFFKGWDIKVEEKKGKKDTVKSMSRGPVWRKGDYEEWLKASK